MRLSIGLLYRLLLPPVLDRINNDPGADTDDHDAGDHLPVTKARAPSLVAVMSPNPTVAKTVTVK